jgi:PAS domain S-box-containing protein
MNIYEAGSLFLILTSLISGALLLLMWRLDHAEPALGTFGLLHMLGLVANVLGVPFFSFEGAPYVIDVFTGLTTVGFLLGALQYTRRPIPWRLLAAVAIVLVTLLASLRSSLPTTAVLTMVETTLIIVGLLATTWAFSQRWREAGYWYYGALTWLCLGWAISYGLLPLIAGTEAGFLASSLIRSGFRLTSSILLALASQRYLIERMLAQVASRQRAETTAVANQRRFEDLVDLASDWVWEIDRDLRFTFVSPQIYASTGIPAEDYLGQTIKRVRPGREMSGAWPELLECFEYRRPFRNLMLQTRHGETGRIIHIMASAKPIHDESGRFIGYRGAARDLTAQVETRSALDAIVDGVAHAVGEGYFQALVRHLVERTEVDVAFVAAPDPNRQHALVLAWHDRENTETVPHYTLAGTPSERVMKEGFLLQAAGITDLYPDDSVFSQHRMEGYAGTPLRDSAGTPIGVLVLLARQPMTNPDLVRVVLSALAPRAAAELERQLSERRLREQEQRFRAVLDNMPIGVVLKSEGRLLVVNETVARWFGAARQDLEELPEGIMLAEAGWSVESQRALRLLQQEAETQSALVTREINAPLADGRAHDILVSAFPVIDGAGKAIAHGIAMTDITELRRVQAHLTQAQKMDALGRLAGGVAHDFNNIVGAIAGFARFIVEDTPENSDIHLYGERILTASTRAKQLIQQILAFSRRKETKAQRIPLAPILDETVALLRATLPGTTRIESRAAAPDLAIDGDPAQLGQVLVNVCVNASDALLGRTGSVAIEASGQSGAEVARELEQAEPVAETPSGSRLVAGSVDRTVDYIRIGVRDTGMGMSREVLERIFDPFFTTKPAGHGTGLGLPVVQGIVTGLGGAIAVTSRPGEGTDFRIWLPQASAGRPAAARSRPARPAGGRRRILVVDDDDDFGDMVAASMERLGYEVAVATRAQDAIEAFEDDPALWDLVITDQNMPVLSGLEMIARLRGRRPDIPCILCTGYADSTVETAATRAQVSAFLPKPVDPVVLGQTVSTLLRAAS